MARRLTLGLVALVLLTPVVSAAHGRSRVTVVVGTPFVVARPFVHPRPFVVVSPFPAYAYPYPVYVNRPIVYGVPTYYYGAPTYSVDPTYAGTTQTVAPLPTVVQYPHGRYELRGDGVTLPYYWVWIPNPPPPPPDHAASSIP